MANTLRVKVTDATVIRLPGRRSACWRTTAQRLAPTVITEPDGMVEISVTSQTAGTSAVTASINNSSLSRNVKFIADVRHGADRDLEVDAG